MNTAVIILAAGNATRMQSRTPKYMHKIGGQPILDYIIETCSKFDFSHKILVTNPNFKLERAGWQSVIQTQAKGTGAAVLAAKEALSNFKGNILILYSDSPFISESTIKKMIEEQINKKTTTVSLIFEPKDPKHYGRIILDNNNLVSQIVEFKDATDSQKEIRLCNGGNIICDSEHLFSLLEKVGNNNASGEYWLTDIISIANAEGCKCGFVLGDESEVIGVNTREELAKAEAFFQARKRKEIMEKGVTLLSPSTTFFSYDTEIGEDSIIEPCVYFAEGVTIPPNSRVTFGNRLTKTDSFVKSKHPIEKVFSFKLVIFISLLVLFLLSPIFIWLNADSDKKHLCLQSLEMCIITNKQDSNSIGVIGCSYSNLKCLLTDKNNNFQETIEIDSSDIKE